MANNTPNASAVSLFQCVEPPGGHQCGSLRTTTVSAMNISQKMAKPNKKQKPNKNNDQKMKNKNDQDKQKKTC